MMVGRRQHLAILSLPAGHSPQHVGDVMGNDSERHYLPIAMP